MWLQSAGLQRMLVVGYASGVLEVCCRLGACLALHGACTAAAACQLLPHSAGCCKEAALPAACR